jgi:hypothetical protein
LQYYTDAAAPEIRKAFEEEVLRWPEVTTRPMFGCPSYQAAGRLFAFLVDEGIVITQLLKAERDALARRHELGEFKAGERVIGGWARVTVGNPRELAQVLSYVRASYERVLDRRGHWDYEEEAGA